MGQLFFIVNLVVVHEQFDLSVGSCGKVLFQFPLGILEVAITAPTVMLVLRVLWKLLDSTLKQ